MGGYSDYAGLEGHLATLKRCLPAGMKLIVQMGYIFMGAWQFLGFENFCMQLADDPEFVAAVVKRLGTSQLAVLEILLQHEIVGAVWLNDDLCYNSGPVVAPRVYERLIYPWYRAQVERCHAAGIPAGLHSDGDLTKLLPGLVGCGFDGIHPFEPPLNDIVAIKRGMGEPDRRSRRHRPESSAVRSGSGGGRRRGGADGCAAGARRRVVGWLEQLHTGFCAAGELPCAVGGQPAIWCPGARCRSGSCVGLCTDLFGTLHQASSQLEGTV